MNKCVNKNESELLKLATQKFEQKFGKKPEAAASAPGRVNLIGDHVDYCEGFVLPAALQFRTLVVGSLNKSPLCRIVSITECGEELETSFQSPKVLPLKPGSPAWANYVKGVIANFPDLTDGFDAVIVSDVPMGGGVSSSAALEVAVFTFLEALTVHLVDPVSKALACQKAEHDFAKMPCGIMDQFISTLAKKGHALLIDCRSLEATHISLNNDDMVILVTNSNVKHKLTGSEYPQRKMQCQEAARIMDLKSLRDFKVTDLKDLKDKGADSDVLKRAEHVVKEIERTERAAELLQKGDLNKVGTLFHESHTSLSHLMEVSCAELDELVEIARKVPGVYGSRMTGGGFGGCVVSLIHKNHVEDFKSAIKSNYRGNPTFFICDPSDGAHIIHMANIKKQ